MGRLCLAGVLGALALAAVLPAAASADTVWLCRPGSPNPCNGSLKASVVTPAGLVTGATVDPKIDAKAPIDCFYVYPTVSDQPGPLATLDIDQAEKSIALYQASPFSQTCRVWAPMYRQLTLTAINAPAGTVSAAQRATAYDDVRSAWLDYLRHDNHGRGVVFIGHSQGTFMLRQLLAQEVDPKPAVRKRLVGALLLGGNVTVAKGRDVGGDFRHIPACRRDGQTGCVVAYSTFDQPVPADSRFGRTTEAGQEVLCTNPASLRGGSGVLDSAEPTTPFGGTIGAAIDLVGMTVPAVDTPWIVSRGGYSARCSHAGGADVLQVTAQNGAPTLNPVPTAGWGLHLADMNLAMGNLVGIVRAQSRAYRHLPVTGQATTRHPQKPGKQTQQLYVSLGDSYAVGYQPTAPHVGTSTLNGYANQLVPLAQKKGYHLKLVNFGCGGATTTSILQTPGCQAEASAVGGPVYTDPQADAAVAYIRAHRKQVALITVSIGGNDVTACAGAADPIACVGAATTSIRTNVTDLARRLRAAAGPRARIVGITYPDVILGDWVLGNPQLASLSVVAFQSLINPALKDAYAAARGGFVDVTAATGAYTPLDQTTTSADYGIVPVAVAQVCDLTYFCQFQDIHARTPGYRVIAQLIADALPRAD